MPITIHAYRRTFCLSNAESDFTAQDGDVLEKTINSDYTITIPDGATVTLQGAGINDESKVTNSHRRTGELPRPPQRTDV